MQVKPSPLSQPTLSIKTLLFSSCLPLSVGLLCDSLLYLVEEKDYPIQNGNQLEIQGNLLVFLLSQAKEISYGVYSSFLQFMTTMMIIHLLHIVIQRLKLFFDGNLSLSGEAKKSFETKTALEVPKFKKIKTFLLMIFGYALLFYLFSILGTSIEEANPLQSLELKSDQYLSQNFERIKIPSRILQEEEDDEDGEEDDDQDEEEEDISHHDHDQHILSPKNYTTFPLGRMLGSVSIDAASILFSKDETTMFATRANFFGFSEVNLLNWKDPKVRGNGVISERDKQKVAMLLSPDGKTLFMSTMDFLVKFNVDDSGSLQGGESSSSKIEGPPKDLEINLETSLALSPDGTKLFASGYGLLVFDISETSVDQIKYELPPKEWNLSTVAVSSDGKFLFLINGTLNVYDITDLDSMKLISSVPSDNTPSSFVQSKDGKILTVLGFQKNTNKIVIEKFDVSNVRAPLLIKTISLNIESFSSSLSKLAQSPKETYLYFKVTNEASESKMMVFDTTTEKLLEDTQDLISKAKSLLFTADEKNLMIVYEGHIASVQLYRSTPNDRFFSISTSTFAKIPTTPAGLSKILKEFSSILLSVNEISESSRSRFTFTDISNKSLPVEITSFSADSDPISVRITEDKKTLCTVFKSRIAIFDISDLKSKKVLGAPILAKPYTILDAVFTSDGKTLFAIMATENPPRLVVFDLSDPASLKMVDSAKHIAFNFSKTNMQLVLSKDEKTIFMVGDFIYACDVSARKIGAKRTFMSVSSFEKMSQSVSLSPDGSLLAIKREALHSSNLLLFDVRDPFYPKERIDFALPKPKVIKSLPVQFSPDGELAFVDGVHGGQASLLVLNISNPADVIFQSVIQAKGDSADNFIISGDGHTAYLASNAESQIHVLNLNVSNTVYLGTESFRLGERTPVDVMILRKNNHGDYVSLTKDYRFVKASLFSTKIVPTSTSVESTFAPFPYWMTFQKDSGTFSIEPKKQTDLKAYTLYSVFSTQLTRSTFESVYSDPDQIQALISSLISLGYLDNDLYVTGNLDTLKSFYLISPNSEKIYQILKENYFETFTIFDIVPSLDLAVSKKKLEIQTTSYNTLKIEITLLDQRIQFLYKNYGPLVPHITGDKTQLAIEGSVADVNNALKNLVVNSEVDDLVCRGTITIWDHLNPSMTQTLKNLSSYFKINEAPTLNMTKGFTLQEQINSKNYSTGNEFSLPLLKNTFLDKYTDTENLRFTLTLNDTKRSSVSDWLTFSDGILKGTPKKEFFGRSKTLVLTVKNEFKPIEVFFTMEIDLSFGYIFELLKNYSPYILTVLSIWIYANKIYNVVLKGKYRHPKDFYVSVGQEISVQDIYPVSFLGQEGVESDLIWKNLRKEGLDKSNIMEEVKEAVEKIPEKNLLLYKKGSELSQKLINQLIVNSLILWLIELQEEKETKRIYEEEIEPHLMDFVKWDCDGYCQINELKFNEILLKKSLSEEEGMKTKLISQMNVELLKDLVIAKAMKDQSIRRNAVFTHVIIKQEFPGNSIKKFLKLDLQHVQTAQNGQNMIYGINYEIKNGVLRFSGVPEEMFCQKTIVLQITDLRHQILKEVWIHGVKSKGKERDSNYNELEAQGRKYEIL